MGLSWSEIDLILDVIIMLALITNVLVIGKALEMIDCIHDYMHDVLDNIVPVEVTHQHEEIRDTIPKLFEDLP